MKRNAESSALSVNNVSPETACVGLSAGAREEKKNGSKDPPLQEARRHSHRENGTGLKTRQYKKSRHYGDFHGADQEVPEGARLIQSIVWEPE